MTKILAVFGATGQQGGSVVRHVLDDPQLSKEYKIRAITRNVDSDAARRLPVGVDVVAGDVLDRASIAAALAGAQAVFAMTTPAFGPDGLDVEFGAGRVIADAAVEQGVEYIVFSTLPPVRAISGGRFAGVTPFEAKVKIEQHIRGLPIKSAFLSPGSFMENLESQTSLAPRPRGDGTWVLARHHSSRARLPLIDAVGDTGKFVGAMLAEPDRFQGKTLCAATALYSLDEIVAIISKATGKTVVYEQIPRDEFHQMLPPPVADIFTEFFSYLDEFDYYGPDSEQLVAFAAASARGRLSTFEEYMQAHPLKLQD